jgi:hypothetical protein
VKSILDAPLLLDQATEQVDQNLHPKSLEQPPENRACYASRSHHKDPHIQQL